MDTPAVRVLVICFAVTLLLLNKPLSRLTASWQKMLGPGELASEASNRVFFIAGGLIFFALAIWGN
jgi:hypothetical protein